MAREKASEVGMGDGSSTAPIRLAHALTLLIVLWVNGLAGAGRVGVASVGELANRHTSFLLPASFTFGIWGIIYLGLAGWVALQALPTPSGDRARRRIGGWWEVTGALNIAWLLAFVSARFTLALALMTALLLALIAIDVRLASTEDEPGRGLLDRGLTELPFTLYLAWITVALIANTAHALTAMGWEGGGIPPFLWALIMMTVATLLGMVMVLLRGHWIFPLVVAWALAGIANRFPETTWVAGGAWALVVLGVGSIPLLLLLRRRRSHR